MEHRARHEATLALAVGAGGAIGGGARWLVSQAIADTPGAFPWSTFVENVTGCLLIGALMAVLLDATEGPLASPYTRGFLAVGVLGGYTTFSTFSVQIVGLLRVGHGPVAIAYVLASALVGVLGAWSGLVGTQSVLSARRRRRGGHG